MITTIFIALIALWVLIIFVYFWGACCHMYYNDHTGSRVTREESLQLRRLLLDGLTWPAMVIFWMIASANESIKVDELRKG